MILNLILCAACVFFYLRLRVARRRVDQLAAIAKGALACAHESQRLAAESHQLASATCASNAAHLKALEARFDIERHAATFADREFLKGMGVTV